MGLFDIFKKKREKEDSKDELGILLSMPLFVNNEGYEINKVIAHLKEIGKVEVSDDKDATDETALFKINGQMVAIATMPVPVPKEELESIAPFNYFWPTAMEELENHTNHAIVTVMGGSNSRVDQYRILTKILVAILDTSSCIGIYQGSQTLLMPRDYYLGNAQASEQLPVPLWVYLGIIKNTEDTTSVYTYGMAGFGKLEMEIIDSVMDVEQVYSYMLDIASYVIGKDISFKNGETLGPAESVRFKISISDGVNLDGKTLKFEM